jgi:hypothetical protein
VGPPLSLRDRRPEPPPLPDHLEWPFVLPVRLDDLQMGRAGDVDRARYRIAAASPGGSVPDDVP